MNLAVIAKAPEAGRSKTRLCPPCTPSQAADLAEAALIDTLGVLARVPARRRVIVLDGAPGAWLPPGFDVIAQRGEGLAERLAAAFEDIGGPTLLVGMDTPQMTPGDLLPGVAALAGGAPATLGLAPDGGYWAIGLAAPCRAVFSGVPMSVGTTGARQLAQLRAQDIEPAMLGRLRDVDRYEDAVAVARLAPRTRFAGVLARLELGQVRAA